MVWLRLLIVWVGIALTTGSVGDPAHGPILVINSSDQHSAYNNIPNFIENIYSLRATYLKENPQGTVILVINGDFSGLSRWAVDQGDLNFKILEALAPDFELVVNIGNHEGFDWEGRLGNSLFIRQNRQLAARLSALQKKPFKLINANLPIDPSVSDFIAPHRDITFGNGKRIRFVGLALEEFFIKSDYDPSSEPKIFQGTVTPQKLEIERQLHVAAKDGVDLLSFAVHDGVVTTASLIKQTSNFWKSRYPSVKPAPWLAAHDHRLETALQSGHVIIDGGERFGFASCVLSETGQCQKILLHPQTKVLPRVSLPENARSAIELAQQTVAKVTQNLDRPLANLPGELAWGRKDLQGNRHALGSAVADSLADWGHSALTETRWKNLPVVAFFNSSSYRLETALPAGPITVGTIRDIYPHELSVRMGIVSGEDLNLLFSTLRKYREQEADPRRRYTPQLSSMLLEGLDYGLSLHHLSEPTNVSELKEVVIVFDGWLSKNGYGIYEWKEIFDRIHWIVPDGAKQTEIFEQHLPARLVRLAQCSDQIASFPHTSSLPK